MVRGTCLAQALLLLAALPLAALPAEGGYPCPSEPAPAAARDACAGVALPLLARTAPPDDDHVVLLGEGQASVMLAGVEKSCQGPSRFVLEASHKAGGFEPTATFWYGGSRHGGAYLLACAQGQLRQPMSWHLDQPFGGFGGAWSATLHNASWDWHIEVGAPVDGVRDVAYWYRSVDGLTRHDFDGAAYEAR